MDGINARIPRRKRSRFDGTSFFLLQILVCILSASTLVSAQTDTDDLGDGSACLSGVDQKEINRLFSEGTHEPLAPTSNVHVSTLDRQLLKDNNDTHRSVPTTSSCLYTSQAGQRLGSSYVNRPRFI